MKIAVIGSRQVNNYTWFIVSDTLKEYKPSLIITGGAVGVDTLAEFYADSYEIPKNIILPNYEKYGRPATHIRNREIVNGADLVLAFWDGSSPGTKSVIKYARKRNKQIRVITI